MKLFFRDNHSNDFLRLKSVSPDFKAWISPILEKYYNGISTEELLQKALIKLSKNRTTIVIAHRLSTIIDADKIVYLKDGKVKEEGKQGNASRRLFFNYNN